MKKPGLLFKTLSVVFLLLIGILFIWYKRKKNSEPISSFQSIAESQFEAMRNYGTDEDLIFLTLQGLKKDELIKVYNSFGSRTYTSGGKGISFFGFNLVGEPLDLFGWYSAELSEKEKTELRKIWKASGLKLTF